MDAYCEDLRNKTVEKGMSKAEVARLFGVGISFVKRYIATVRTGRSLVPK